jgi:hypothetical protein
MDAAVWTAIGLLAAFSLGTLVYLGARIDAVGGRMDARSDHLESRLDGLAARLDTHIERHAGTS